MRKSRKKLTLTEKLIEIRKALSPIEADRNNGEYDWVPASKLMIMLRTALDKQKLLLIIDETEVFEEARGEWHYARVRTSFTVRDSEAPGEQTVTGYGSAWAYDSTALYKAKTGALKYFLRSIGMVPFLYMDRSEVEWDTEPRPADDSVYESPKGLTKDARKRLDQMQAFDIKCNQTGKTHRQRMDYLATLGSISAGDLKKEAFGKAMLWAAGMESLEETLQNSVVVEMRKGESTQ
jgi:hypothetical protein